jgi:hypothetical protein
MCSDEEKKCCCDDGKKWNDGKCDGKYGLQVDVLVCIEVLMVCGVAVGWLFDSNGQKSKLWAVVEVVASDGSLYAGLTEMAMLCYVVCDRMEDVVVVVDLQ